MERKIVILYTAILAITTCLMVRLADLSQGSGLQSAAATQSSYGVVVGETRGTIYDRNLKPLVNRSCINILAVAPTPEAVTALQSTLPKEEFLRLVPLLESGKPTVLQTSKAVSAGGIDAFRLPVRYGSGSLAPHVLGYLDGGGNGVSGIEAGYNTLLRQAGGKIQLRYDINAVGAALGNTATEIRDSRPEKAGGVVITLDRKLQHAAEVSASAMEQGAVVIMDVKTGEILAMVSCPDFDPDNVEASLQADGSPLFNRATAAYNVGSTFKLVVAAAALESGYTTDYTYVCPGYYRLGEQRYHCHQREGHWELSMERAMKQSCNPYFINLGQQLGSRRLLGMAAAMGFGNALQLAEGITSSSGTLPRSPSDISDGELANLSFGQGELTATPVQITQMTAIIAGGGNFVKPTLLCGTTEDGFKLLPAPAQVAEPVISGATAATLRHLMELVVSDGSGRVGAPSYGGAGGKTGSAQTGIYRDGKEIVHGWFTGFYPGENPQYAITVLEEGGGNGGALPAEIFADLCNKIALHNDYYLRRNAE